VTRSHASVRSYYFRELVLDIHSNALEHYALADFRPLWRKANAQARAWRQRATTIWKSAARSLTFAGAKTGAIGCHNRVISRKTGKGVLNSTETPAMTRVVIVGEIYHADLSIGGGPIVPPGQPPGIWGGPPLYPDQGLPGW
jgi:hypothetical protein